MTSHTTPDLHSPAWLGNLADELTPEQVHELTQYRAGFYQGHGDLDTATRRALVIVVNEVGYNRLDKRTAGRPMPEWSVSSEPWQPGSDFTDPAHRHHDVGATVEVTVSAGLYSDPSDTMGVTPTALEMEDGAVTFAVTVSSPDSLPNLSPAEARQLAAALLDAADRADATEAGR